MSDEKNESAFPAAVSLAIHSQGLTKRELFSAMAMQGLLSAIYSDKEMLNDFCQINPTTLVKDPHKHLSGREAVSRNAVSYADALILELAKEEG